MDSRRDLEQHLLKNPFDAEVRRRYALLLLEGNEAEEAIVQFELLCQQQSGIAAAHVDAACALLRLGRTMEALSRYEKARDLPGFEANRDLDALASQAVRTAPPQLRVVPEVGPTNVVSIPRGADERVRFSSIVGMDDLKQTIRLKIVEPFLNPGLFQRFRKQAGGGILLYGPPGCGKTMIAKAVANECRAELLSVGIADVLNMWIGESERNLALVFDKARAQAPCVLFFDELDALAYSRSKANSEHTRTVVNEFLAQLDGLGKDNRGVLILAATNMPWDVDPAMKRPGRFSRQIFVPPPDGEARREMLRLKLVGIPCEDIKLEDIAVRTANFSGADIDGLIEFAKETALHHALTTKQERPISRSDFEAALSELQPSTLDWLRTARNLVKYTGSDASYREVEAYLKKTKLL